MEEWPLVASNDASIDHCKDRSDGCDGRCLFPILALGSSLNLIHGRTGWSHCYHVQLFNGLLNEDECELRLSLGVTVSICTAVVPQRRLTDLLTNLQQIRNTHRPIDFTHYNLMPC